MVKRDIRDYLNGILTHIDFVLSFVEGTTFDEFKNDNKTVFALTRVLEIIREAAKQIPLTVREQYSDMAWRELAGMRDKIAHATSESISKLFGIRPRKTCQN